MYHVRNQNRQDFQRLFRLFPAQWTHLQLLKYLVFYKRSTKETGNLILPFMKSTLHALADRYIFWFLYSPCWRSARDVKTIVTGTQCYIFAGVYRRTLPGFICFRYVCTSFIELYPNSQVFAGCPIDLSPQFIRTAANFWQSRWYRTRGFNFRFFQC